MSKPAEIAAAWMLGGVPDFHAMKEAARACVDDGDRAPVVSPCRRGVPQVIIHRDPGGFLRFVSAGRNEYCGLPDGHEGDCGEWYQPVDADGEWMIR